MVHAPRLHAYYLVEMRMQNSSRNEWIEAMMMVCFCCCSDEKEGKNIESDEKTCETNLVSRIQFICFAGGVEWIGKNFNHNLNRSKKSFHFLLVALAEKDKRGRKFFQ
jgi:hypothetical protein